MVLLGSAQRLGSLAQVASESAVTLGAPGPTDPLTGCPLPAVDLQRSLGFVCVEWRKACLDQNAVIVFDPAVHPAHAMADIPTLNVSDVMYNYPSK